MRPSRTPFFFSTLALALLILATGRPSPAQLPREETAKGVVKDVAKDAAAAAKAADEAVKRIKDEGSKNSQVMATLSHLTDVIGPRLTASPNMKQANLWTRDKLTEWGLRSARLEPWGPFGRGWTLKRFSAQVVEPQCIPIIAYPKAWSPGTDGPVTGEVVYVEARDEAALEKFKGKLKGAVVLRSPIRNLKAHFESIGTRMTEKELLRLADAAEPTPRGMFRGFGRRGGAMSPEALKMFAFMEKREKFLIDEGVAMIVENSFAGDGGTLFVDSASAPPSMSGSAVKFRRSWDKDAPKMIPQMVVSTEHYNRMMRMLKEGEKLKMTADLAVEFHDDDLMGYNTVAEIPGTDLKDEVVMLGGHMDSWHSGTGATDNAAGVSCAMEAVRIIQALKLQPRRTIRIALWSGEEQGLFGSKGYVEEHLGARDDGSPAAKYLRETFGARLPRPLKTKPDYEKFSAYFNLDNGTGKIRGVYMEGNEAVRPIFRRWLAPFRDMGAATLTIAPTFGTDHQSFDDIGLPAFQFIQDEIEYDTRTHHSNQDLYDRIQADDMKQASVIFAAFVYNAAMADEKLPRKPAPRP